MIKIRFTEDIIRNLKSSLVIRDDDPLCIVAWAYIEHLEKKIKCYEHQQ